MIAEQRKLIHQILGPQTSEDIRQVLRQVINVTWEVPHVRFSPLMLEHLLYFIARNLPILNSHLFPRLLSSKFFEEYGYAEHPTIVEQLVEDLVQSLRVILNDRFPLMKVAPRRALEKVFREIIVLYLEGCSLDNRTEESIRQLSGLPVSFLKQFFSAFEDIQQGKEIDARLEADFGKVLRSLSSELTDP